MLKEINMDIVFLIVLTIALIVVFAVDNIQKQRNLQGKK